MTRKRGRHSAAFKAKVAQEAAEQTRAVAELAKVFQVHPAQISRWNKQLLDRAESLFRESHGLQPWECQQPHDCHRDHPPPRRHPGQSHGSSRRCRFMASPYRLSPAVARPGDSLDGCGVAFS
jgi:Transposase